MYYVYSFTTAKNEVFAMRFELLFVFFLHKYTPIFFASFFRYLHLLCNGVRVFFFFPFSDAIVSKI